MFILDFVHVVQFNPNPNTRGIPTTPDTVVAMPNEDWDYYHLDPIRFDFSGQLTRNETL